LGKGGEMVSLPFEIILNDEAPGSAVNVKELAVYLQSHLPAIKVSVEGAYFSKPGSRLGYVATEFARARVRSVFTLSKDQQPLPGEVRYERRRLDGQMDDVFGIPYDGMKVQRLASALLPVPDKRESEGQVTEPGSASTHIIFTNQLLGTWDADDRRFHLRAAIFGFPSLISTSGIVEAPAKPRAYYYLRDRLAEVSQSDIAAATAKQEFAGSFLVHGDARLTEVAKGYVMQAVFFHAMGDPFCEEPNCRLFNAHWQEELLHSQLSEPEFCERHARMLGRFKSESEKRKQGRE
jgi:hypothetical protein